MKYIWLVIALTTACVPGWVRGEEPEYSVCRIESLLETGEKHELTGFKVKGRPGIYTALHGVLGVRKVDAIFHDPRTRRVSLKLSEVDIDRDVAYLTAADSSPDALPSGGLALGVWPSASQLEETLAGKPASVIGHPLGIDLKPTHSQLALRSKRPIARLTELLNPSARRELSERGSPSTGVLMLSLEGPFLPGHSGAPILDEDGAVIGIGNGGLKEGQAGHGWATPFHEISLAGISEEGVQERLNRIPPMSSNRALFLVVDDAVRQQTELRTEITATVETDDSRPVQAFRVPRSHSAASIDADTNSAGQPSALEDFLSGRVFLVSGTPVTIRSEASTLKSVLPDTELPTGLDGLFVRVSIASQAKDEGEPSELFVPLSSIRQRGHKTETNINNYGILVTGDVTGMVAGRDIIIINPRREPTQKYILDNDGASTLVLKEETQELLFGAVSPENHVGFAVRGTEIRLLEDKRRVNPVIVFRLVEILSGELKGKRGWVSQNVIRSVESP